MFAIKSLGFVVACGSSVASASWSSADRFGAFFSESRTRLRGNCSEVPNYIGWPQVGFNSAILMTTWLKRTVLAQQSNNLIAALQCGNERHYRNLVGY